MDSIAAELPGVANWLAGALVGDSDLVGDVMSIYAIGAC